MFTKEETLLQPSATQVAVVERRSAPEVVEVASEAEIARLEIHNRLLLLKDKSE